MLKKFASLLIALALCLTLLPADIAAAEDIPPAPPETTELTEESAQPDDPDAPDEPDEPDDPGDPGKVVPRRKVRLPDEHDNDN